ncbi:MAG: hypothetical protein CVU64_02055 [Deltaproteobacteria bacterium HGW-Deltaproteobacteria-21]|nr:MAG: hypothetical protein CVU64_02055 [Deltaproteobacteria bacterium HGW-Deltaproteobacteria-21]
MNQLTVILAAAFVSFLFGILSHIIYGVISNSRTKKRVGCALSQEIEVNFYQVRDGRNYGISKKDELRKRGRK